MTLYNRNRNGECCLCAIKKGLNCHAKFFSSATTINSDELWRRPATVSKHHQWPPPLSATNEELPRSESSLLSSTDLSVIGSDSPNTDFASADLRINIRHHSSSTLHQQQQKMLNSRSASEGIQHCSSTNSITTSSTITATATATSSSSSSVKASFVLAKTDKGAKVDQVSGFFLLFSVIITPVVPAHTYLVVYLVLRDNHRLLCAHTFLLLLFNGRLVSSSCERRRTAITEQQQQQRACSMERHCPPLSPLLPLRRHRKGDQCH